MKLTPRQRGTNPKARGTNPRALGTNPRALGTNPRALGANLHSLREEERRMREFDEPSVRQKSYALHLAVQTGMVLPVGWDRSRRVCHGAIQYMLSMKRRFGENCLG